MNIHFYAHNGHLDGASIMLTTLAAQLQSWEHQCTLFLPHEGLLTQRIQQKNLSHHIALSFNTTAQTPDIVVANTLLRWDVVEECSVRNIPVIWIIHESNPALIDKKSLANCFAKADIIVFPSQYTKKLYIRYDKGNSVVIPNGIDIDRIVTAQQQHHKQDLRKRYHIPQSADVFLSIGTHHQDKGFSTLISAATQTIREHPHRNIHVIIAGRIPSAAGQIQADALLRTAWEHGIRDRIHLFADFPLVEDLYGLADYYVCASRLETYPLTILEAKAFGLPIIATHVGGIPEQVSDGVHGILIKPEKPRILADAMKRMLEQPIAYDPVRCDSAEMAQQYHALMQRFEKMQNSIPPHLGEGPSVSLILRASKPDTVRDAVTAALATFPRYHELIVAASPALPEDTVAYLQTIDRVRIIPGTANREEAGDVHYRLLDECSGEFIANIDDDDLWTYAPSLTNIASTVGLIHGQYLYLNYYNDQYHHRRFVNEKGHPVKIPEDANGVMGSNWIMRKEAWNIIAPHMTNRSFNHSDWRMYYFLVKHGWELQYINRIMGIERRFTYDFPTGPGSRWNDSVTAIAAEEASS